MAYRLPLPGKLSILHRVSGAAMFLALPVILLPLLDMSLTSEYSFDQFRAIADHWYVKVVFFGLLWSFLHHFCAGIRYLMLDRHIGLEKAAANRSALVVFIVSLALTVVLGLKLFGVF
ncbi:succinate dehydrogenase, cytochrome b556 subunit [soil metagenome]